MGVLGAIGVITCAVVSGVMSRIVADDLKAWSPKLVSHLIKRASAKLPEPRQERLREEWQSHIDQTPGDIGRVLVAIGFLKAARTIARDVARKARSGHDRGILEMASLARGRNVSVYFEWTRGNVDQKGKDLVRAIRNGEVWRISINMTVVAVCAPGLAVNLYALLDRLTCSGRLSLVIAGWGGERGSWRRYFRAHM